jgi:tetratricopeptide (TPR) repeat protein
MTTLIRRLSAVGLMSFAALLASAEDAVVYEDAIIPRDSGPVVDVNIIEDSWKNVSGRKVQGQLSVPSFNILEVEYSDAPRTFAKGVQRVKRGFYSKAIEESFEPALKDVKKFRVVGGRPWPEQYCLYYLGLSHLKRAEAPKGDPAKARDYFEKLVGQIPDSRFLMDSLMGIGEAWDIEGRHEEAAKAYKKAQDRFEAMSKENGVSGDLRWHVLKYARTAELRQVQMLDAQKKWQLAKSAYDRLVMASRDYPDIQALARVGAVKALVSDKVYDVAIRKCNEMIEAGEREGQTQFLGGAYLALADCYFERAGDNATADDLVAARWYYLRVATLYFGDNTIISKARYRAGRCYERLATESQEGGAAKRGIELARRQYRIVVEQFGDSPWAIQAKNCLAAIGKSG